MRGLLSIGLALAALILPALAPSGQAAEVSAEHCLIYEVSNVAAVINAGTVRFCNRFPTEVAHDDSVFQFGASFTGPLITAVGPPVLTFTLVSATGCTVGTVQVRSVVVGTGSTLATWTAPITMTNEFCSGKTRILVQTAALSTLVDAEMPFNVRSQDSTTQVDNQNRLCAASAFEADCATPNMNNAVSQVGSWTITDDANGWAINQSCGDSASDPCHIRHQNFTADVAIGNHTVAFPSNLTVAATFPGDVSDPGLDFWFMLLFWIAALLFFTHQGWLVAAVFALPGLLDAIIPSLPFGLEEYLILCLLGFCLEIAANRFRWGNYESGRRRLRFVE